MKTKPSLKILWRRKNALEIVKTKENSFLNTDIEELLRVAETLTEEAEEADIFGSDDSEDSEDEYDSASEESGMMNENVLFQGYKYIRFFILCVCYLVRSFNWGSKT